MVHLSIGVWLRVRLRVGVWLMVRLRPRYRVKYFESALTVNFTRRSDQIGKVHAFHVVDYEFSSQLSQTKNLSN